jgi:transaldolase/glucose-6-phosphate isomerase
MSKLHELAKLGQAIWYDYIRRAFLTPLELGALIEQGLRGVTSNPSIFEKAIAGSADYDKGLSRLILDKNTEGKSGQAGKAVDEIYEALALEDIRRAADLLRPVYEATNALDGYVSLEVSPKLAHDTNSTIAEAQRLFKTLSKPNVMIKVPATPEGISAIAALIAQGININVTLIFSNEVYKAVAEAYIAGLEKLAANGGDLSKVASVASFFVSRIDSAVDPMLAAKGNTTLQGKIAIANAKMAYLTFKQIFGGPRWEKLTAKKAQVQRPLWASTGVKNPQYPDTLYVDTLIGPHTVNTVPPATLNAFLDHGKVALTLETSVDEAKAQLAQLQAFEIDFNAVTKKLLDEGVSAFVKSFETLMASIAEKRGRLLAGQKSYSFSLGEKQTAVEKTLANLRDNNIMARIWKHDHTVWKPDPAEITNRLGWLHSPEVMMDAIPEITAFADSVRAEGYTQALLLGMGGSSLAPEVFRFTFGVKPGYLDLAVLDSTDPDAVLAHAKRLDPAKTLFIVSTKSGGTVETFSFFKYFYNWTAEKIGQEKTGAHFIAITDPGSGLAGTAKKYNFRQTFLNDPNIGGRYSALSYFGLVPAALIGVDLKTLLERAQTMACNSEGCNCPHGGDNSSAKLGAVMGELALAGRDKLTLVLSPPIKYFGAWAEQLIAESTGKEGKGILPVDGEELGAPEAYVNDRLFIYLRREGDTTHDAKVEALRQAGHPVVQLNWRDLGDLGAEFFRWEMATAVAGWGLGINPFDQPNVESAKVLARQMVAAYQKEGKLPELAPRLRVNGVAVYSDFAVNSLGEALNQFLALAQPGRSYVALQAFVQPAPETGVALHKLRAKIQTRWRLATTVGYGPRFLHSTGQLHKGDAGNGLFIQFTSDPIQEVPIPDEAGAPKSSITFGVLIMAQALGDRQALLNTGRRVMRFHLGKNVAGELQKLAEAIGH